jgi:hypothetical protein
MIFSAPVVFLNSYLSQKKTGIYCHLMPVFAKSYSLLLKLGSVPNFQIAEKTPQPRATRLAGLGIIAQVVFIESLHPWPFSAPATGAFVPVDRMPRRSTLALYIWDWPAECAGSRYK